MVNQIPFLPLQSLESAIFLLKQTLTKCHSVKQPSQY